MPSLTGDSGAMAAEDVCNLHFRFFFRRAEQQSLPNTSSELAIYEVAFCSLRFGSALANGPLDAFPQFYAPIRHADLLATDISEELCIKYIDRFLMFYIATAERLQRTSAWMEKLEGGACRSLDQMPRLTLTQPDRT